MADGSQSLIPRIYVAPISPNVTQNHIREIMGHFGNIDTVDFSSMQTVRHIGSRFYDLQDKVVVGIANIVYDSQESVQSAIKHMDKVCLTLVYSVVCYAGGNRWYEDSRDTF